MSEVVVANGLTKAYGQKYAVYNLNIQITSGEIFGLLGPNGSGKSTFLKMCMGITKPSYGRLIVNGHDPVLAPLDVRAGTCYVPEAPVIYESLTPIELFDFVGSVRHIPTEQLQRRVMEFTKAFGIQDRLNDMIGSLSYGTKQKVAIISALLHDSKLLILDEPLNGLDPRSARILKDLLKELATKGCTIIFSTHILEVAENICSRVGIMYQGQLIAQGTVDNLRSMISESKASLEDVFFKVTGEQDLAPIIHALSGDR